MEPFISVEDLSDFLHRDVTTDQAATIAVDASCDLCRTISGQQFNEVIDDVVKFDGTGTDALLLPQVPVTKIKNVKVGATSPVTLTTTEYVLKSNGALIRMSTNGGSAYWPAGRQNVTVTYSHGYSDEDMPRDVWIVALSLAARLFDQGPGVVFEVLGERQVRYTADASDLRPTEAAILRKYERKP